MARPISEIGNAAQIPEHVRRTLDAMARIKQQTAVLLQEVDVISDQLLRLDPAAGGVPAAGEAERQQLEAPRAADEPAPDAGIAAPPAEPTNADDAEVEHLTKRTIQAVMDKIQPLLDALGKIHNERSVPQPLTDVATIEEMSQHFTQRAEQLKVQRFTRRTQQLKARRFT
jgi:hypothetical protein